MFFTQVCCVVLRTVGASPSACPGSPPVFLGRSLDLLWMLCGQLRLRSGLTPACSCFQSPQLPPEVHRLRLNCWNLIHCTGYYRSEFPSPLLIQPLVLQFGFGLTSACVSPSSVYSPPRSEAEKSSGLLGVTFSVGQEKQGYGSCSLCVWGVLAMPKAC